MSVEEDLKVARNIQARWVDYPNLNQGERTALRLATALIETHQRLESAETALKTIELTGEIRRASAYFSAHPVGLQDEKK